MANAFARPTAGATPQNGEGAIQLTKPTDWTIYMIDAALKVVSDETMPLQYQSDNEGKLLILTKLNYYEAHGDYAWPDFAALGFDFANNMRLRRALVHDVYVALEKSGRIQIGSQQVVTPDASDRGRKRTISGGSMTKAKQCGKKQKIEYSDDDTAAANTSDTPFWHDSNFLAETMYLLIDRSGVNVEAYLTGEKDSGALADIVHDGLVDVWDRPQARVRTVAHSIASKSVACAIYTNKKDATAVDSDGDSTASVMEGLKKRQGRETSIELGDHESNRLPHSIP